MDILDIHTHVVYDKPTQAINNINPTAFEPTLRGYYSLGFHPDSLFEENENVEKCFHLLEENASYKRVLAIGEVGIDKRFIDNASMEYQTKIFLKHAELAEKLKKPLVIHCVKAYNEIIQCKIQFNPELPWIIHGFRKSQQTAQQLLDHGFYLSYGKYYDEDSLKTTPIERMFFETDEWETDIYWSYDRAAKLLKMDTEDLIEKVQANIQEVFLSNRKG